MGLHSLPLSLNYYMHVESMDLPRDVGLALLLHPIGSNIVIRTACCTVGTILPAYSTFKAIENDDREEQRKWLVYWAVYGSFSVAEVFADKILSWFPLYYHVKFAYLVWLQLPSANGARHLYMSHLRPFLLRHQSRLDHIVNLLYSEMSDFVSAHQAEIQFVKALFTEIMSVANRTFRDVIDPMRRQGNRAIEGPTAPRQGNRGTGGPTAPRHGNHATEGPTAPIPDPQSDHDD